MPKRKAFYWFSNYRRKRSLGQGNVFTPVCHSAPPPELNTTGYGQQAGGTHPTGMHSCLSYFKRFKSYFNGVLCKYTVIVTWWIVRR